MLSAAGVLGPYFPSTGVFDDIQDAWDIDDWAKDYVAFMLDNDLMAGYDGMFKPKDYVSREEAAIIAYRCFVKYGRDVDGRIQSALKSGTDSNGRLVYTLEKTVMQSNGTVIALRNAPDKQLVTPGGEAVGGEPIVEEDPEPVPDGTGGYAPSGTPLQVPDSDGLYQQARVIWEQVLSRNVNCELAYTGIGKALYEEGEFQEAMTYLKLGYDREAYSQAFRDYRMVVVRKYAPYLLTGLLLLILLVWIGRRVFRHLSHRKEAVQ